MADTITVRDKCTHGLHDTHPIEGTTNRIGLRKWCDGGREIVLLEGEPTEKGDRVFVEVSDE